MSEINKLEKLASGDKDIIQDIYVSVFPKVRSFVLKNHGNQTDAEDVFQKMLLQLIARYKTKPFIIDTSFEAYIFVVCRNLWRRELNKQKKVVTNDTVIELSSEEQDMTMATLEQEKWELFQEKLLEISGTCRELLKLFFQKVPYKKIVDQLGYNNDNVVRQRVFSCKSQLTKLIQKDVRYNQLKEL